MELRLRTFRPESDGLELLGHGPELLAERRVHVLQLHPVGHVVHLHLLLEQRHLGRQIALVVGLVRVILPSRAAVAAQGLGGSVLVACTVDRVRRLAHT